MIDGTLTKSCWPGELRNVNERNQSDQHMFFSGDKGAHRYQVMSALFPNGMLAMSDPIYSRTHNSRLKLDGYESFVKDPEPMDGRILWSVMQHSG